MRSLVNSQAENYVQVRLERRRRTRGPTEIAVCYSVARFELISALPP